MPSTHNHSGRFAITRRILLTAGLGLTLLLACAVDTTDTPFDGDVVAVVVFPPQIALDLDQIQQFLAYGTTLEGDSTLTTVNWSATGGQIGADGMYTSSSNPGDYLVVATHTRRTWLADTAVVSVGRALPGEVVDLDAVGQTESSLTLELTEVDDGAGNAAQYAVRFAPSPIVWGSAQVSEFVVAGVDVGATLQFEIGNLAAGIQYDVQCIAFRGTLDSNAVFSSQLSNIASGTTTNSTAAVAEVSVLPVNPTLAVGSTIQLAATPKDASGNALTGRSITWATTNGSVADVDGSGNVVGEEQGTATITATSEGVAGSTSVTVVAQVVSAAEITPASATVRLGGAKQFAVVARDQFGYVTNATFVWSASGGSITNQGLYTAGSVVGTYEVIATEASGVADTATVTIQEQSTAYPNEPAGLDQLGEHTFPAGYFGDDAHFGAAASYTAPGARWHMRDLSKALHIETDIADAPMSPPGTMGMAYPTGMLSSGEPASFGFFMPEQRELYVSYHFMMPSNPVSGKWELEPAGVKILGYISYGDNDQQNQGFPLFKPGGLQAGPLSARSDYSGKAAVCEDYVDEPNRYQITLDEWHQFEFYGKLNDMGQANGVLRIWLDGELYSQCDQMSYITSSWPHGFWQVHFQPVWGGWHEGLRKTQDDYAYLDHIYVSGVNK